MTSDLLTPEGRACASAVRHKHDERSTGPREQRKKRDMREWARYNQQIGARIAEGEIDLLVLLWDPLEPHLVSGSDVGRLPPGVEQALYFVALEALQNAAKHSDATAVTVLVERVGGLCRLRVEDDGVGFAPGSGRESGAGLANIRDRIDAVGGTVTLTSTRGLGTAVTASVPVSAIPVPRPAA